MVIGPTPPGTGRDRAGDPLRFGEGDVADQPRFSLRARHPVDADIDDDGAFLDPGAAHEFRLADGGDQDIGTPQDIRNIPALGMNEGDGAIFGQEQRRHRLADNIGAAENDRFGAAELGSSSRSSIRQP